MKAQSLGFSLVEILISILIFSIVMVGGFYSLSAVTHGKIKLIQNSDLEKEAFYMSETLFEFIKKGGLIDYEEYFNNSFVQYPPNAPVGSPSPFYRGHHYHNTEYGNRNYVFIPGVGNVSNKVYCLSGNGSRFYDESTLTNTGCLDGDNLNGLTTASISINLAVLSNNRRLLQYGEYENQFLDLNSDADNNLGDEDGDLRIIRDNDDEYIGFGPEAFSGSRVYELYLISGDKKKRTFLRWNVTLDPNRPSGTTCSNYQYGDPDTITGEGCFGKLEYLKLEGMDWGIDNNPAIQDTNGTQLDGKIDTWVYDKQTYGLSSDIEAANIAAHSVYRTSLFPDTMNVKKIEFYVYPNKDSQLAWRENNDAYHIQPYIRLKLVLTPSRKKRKGTSGKLPEFSFTNTISLTDMFSR